MKIKRKILSMLLIGMVFCSYPVCASTTTTIYTHVDDEDIRNAIRSNPLNHK